MDFPIKPISVPKWLQDNKSFFLPPICNKMMYNDQLKVFFVGGPNQRQDYHIEEGEEFFYMLKGDMELKVIERGKPKTILIREGEAFLLPARIPHSPQRFENTMGLVIERERATEELDGLRYYVGDTMQILYERWFHCTNLGTQIAPIIKEFFASPEHKTGIPSSNSQLREPPFSDDTFTNMIEPINLLANCEEEIELFGHKRIFNEEHFATTVFIYGGHFTHLIESGNYETYLWQMTSNSKIEIDNNTRTSLENGSSLIVPPHSKTLLTTQSGGYTLVIFMPAKL